MMMRTDGARNAFSEGVVLRGIAGSCIEEVAGVGSAPRVSQSPELFAPYSAFLPSPVSFATPQLGPCGVRDRQRPEVVHNHSIRWGVGLGPGRCRGHPVLVGHPA